MTRHRTTIRFVAAVTIFGAAALLTFGTSQLRAETGAGCNSSPFNGCISNGQAYQNEACGGSGCYTCTAMTGYRCSPVGSGGDLEDYVYN
jgi:hypothetical protein